MWRDGGTLPLPTSPSCLLNPFSVSPALIFALSAPTGGRLHPGVGQTDHKPLPKVLPQIRRTARPPQPQVSHPTAWGPNSKPRSSPTRVGQGEHGGAAVWFSLLLHSGVSVLGAGLGCAPIPRGQGCSLHSDVLPKQLPRAQGNIPTPVGGAEPAASCPRYFGLHCASLGPSPVQCSSVPGNQKPPGKCPQGLGEGIQHHTWMLSISPPGPSASPPRCLRDPLCPPSLGSLRHRLLLQQPHTLLILWGDGFEQHKRWQRLAQPPAPCALLCSCGATGGDLPQPP